MDKEIQGLFDALDRYAQGSYAYKASVAGLKQKFERLEREIETLRMQLAACGVAAGANTRESAERCKIERDNPYWSDSFQQVFDAVGREMEAREEKDAAIALGLGFGFGKACALLDKGTDPRTIEMAGLFEEYRRAVAVTQQ